VGRMALTYKDVAEILRIIDASELEEVVIEL
jgi:acetyl-CoA carboxylase biotin carboxyl carrier protein